MRRSSGHPWGNTGLGASTPVVLSAGFGFCLAACSTGHAAKLCIPALVASSRRYAKYTAAFLGVVFSLPRCKLNGVPLLICNIWRGIEHNYKESKHAWGLFLAASRHPLRSIPTAHIPRHMVQLLG
jgi:hypothetical protein